MTVYTLRNPRLRARLQAQQERSEHPSRLRTQGFEPGQRVQLHPATDAWMMGDRFGEVVRVTPKFVYVQCDVSQRIRRMVPRNILEIVRTPSG
jgi:hypothetical protein